MSESQIALFGMSGLIFMGLIVTVVIGSRLDEIVNQLRRSNDLREQDRKAEEEKQ